MGCPQVGKVGGNGPEPNCELQRTQSKHCRGNSRMGCFQWGHKGIITIHPELTLVSPCACFSPPSWVPVVDLVLWVLLALPVRHCVGAEPGSWALEAITVCVPCWLRTRMGPWESWEFTLPPAGSSLDTPAFSSAIEQLGNSRQGKKVWTPDLR